MYMLWLAACMHLYVLKSKQQMCLYFVDKADKKADIERQNKMEQERQVWTHSLCCNCIRVVYLVPFIVAVNCYCMHVVHLAICEGSMLNKTLFVLPLPFGNSKKKVVILKISSLSCTFAVYFSKLVYMIFDFFQQNKDLI